MIIIHRIDIASKKLIPYVPEGISAGFPSPALDFEDLKIDLNTEIIKHPNSTFYGRVRGFSMKNAGIDDGDIRLIDKSLQPVESQFTAQRIRKSKDGTL